MDDLGNPISYLVLENGTHVFSSDGKKLGKINKVLADEQRDIFEGIVVDPMPIIPGDLKEIPADRIEGIYERGVVIAPEG